MRDLSFTLMTTTLLATCLSFAGSSDSAPYWSPAPAAVVDASAKTPAWVDPASGLPKPSNQMTLDNFAVFVRHQAAVVSEAEIRTSKSPLERSILFTLNDKPQIFINELNDSAVRRALAMPDGIAILQRVDSLMITASQDLAEKAAISLRSKTTKGQARALNLLSKIQLIEKKRDTMAASVARARNESNYNAVFDFMVQAHFRRRLEAVNQPATFPATVKRHLYGRFNPNQTAFQTLKKMTLEVLAGNDTGPMQNVRLMKITGTALLVPAFKPTLHSWKVEAYYNRRATNRLPSSTGNYNRQTQASSN